MMNEINPFTAIVVAIPFGDDFATDETEKCTNVFDIVLNVGEDDGIAVGNNFLIFSLGPEITDPITRESLGRFEIVRGRGKVTHLQRRMCTVRSTRTVSKPVQNMFPLQSKTDFVNEPAPFKIVGVGDFARLI